MNIITYIRQIGDEQAAKEFGLAVVTVRSWRLGVRRPCRRLGMEIAKKKGWRLEQVFLDAETHQACAGVRRKRRT